MRFIDEKLKASHFKDEAIRGFGAVRTGPMRFTVFERTTPRYTATIVDDRDNVLASGSLSTMTLTLYDKSTGNILNSRDDQNVLNANQVTIDSSGNLVWIVQVQDLALVNTNETNETHVALFEWSWSAESLTKNGKHEIELAVKNLTKVP